MPKRSLNPGKGDQQKIEQLNRAVDLMLTRADGKLPKVNAGVEPLLRLAADLRDLPRESFKARLKSELGGSKPMSTLAEPVAAVRVFSAPRLSYKSAAKAIDFYEKAFGAKESWRFDTGKGIPHAEIMIGDTVVMLCEEWPEGGRFSAETWGHSPVAMTIQVPDVDAAVERALATGATLTIPPTDQFYGYRDATVTDPFGYRWEIYAVKEHMSVEEMHRRMKSMMQGPDAGELRAKEPAVNPIPRGFRTLQPYMIAPDGDALLQFAKQAFGAEEKFRAIGSAGGIHAEVRIGDIMLMMGGGIPGRPFDAKPSTTALHIYVEDTDAVYEKALKAGATSIDEPQDHEYGERGAGVQDMAGNYWYIATHKGESYIPKDLHNVNVYMHPLRAEPAITFLKRSFGAQEVVRYASPDGVVHHAQVRIGDTVVEMGEAHGKYQPLQSTFYVYVPDVDAVYQRALSAGAKSLHAPADQPYGDRNSGVLDPFGNTWNIATHIKDVTF